MDVKHNIASYFRTSLRSVLIVDFNLELDLEWISELNRDRKCNVTYIVQFKLKIQI